MPSLQFVARVRRWATAYRTIVPGLFFCLFFGAWGSSWAFEEVFTHPFTFAPESGTAELGKVCQFNGLILPKDFSVLVAGADSGQPKTIQVDASGKEASRVDVAVNSPNMPVVLMLFSKGPTIWNIGWSFGTEILAVYASGDGRQLVAGITPKVAVLTHTTSQPDVCPNVQVTSTDTEDVNPLALRLFSRSADHVLYPVQNGSALLGEKISQETPFVTYKDNSPDQWKTKQDAELLSGITGLDNSVRLGHLRRANSKDAMDWVHALNQQAGQDRGTGQGATRHQIPLTPTTYVLTGQGGRFKLPPHLYGTQAAIFIVPRGIARPVGDMGHSTVYDFNTMTCVGPACIF